mmetsp:Transcript_37308/g.94773  ORF Transcript_37308/g.94773 Transcript_37308/m.94773 type:complete len:207 (-) Transcript_37308:680-1300(-)
MCRCWKSFDRFDHGLAMLYSATVCTWVHEAGYVVALFRIECKPKPSSNKELLKYCVRMAGCTRILRDMSASGPRLRTSSDPVHEEEICLQTRLSKPITSPCSAICPCRLPCLCRPAGCPCHLPSTHHISDPCQPHGSRNSQSTRRWSRTLAARRRGAGNTWAKCLWRPSAHATAPAASPGALAACSSRPPSPSAPRRHPRSHNPRP